MLLIFDWDGTLSNSAHKIIDCVQKAADSAGVTVLDDDTIRNIIGLGLPEVMQQLYPDLSSHDKERVRQYYVEHFLEADKTPSPFFDGVLEGLQQLRDAGFKLAVATGKSRKGLNRVLQNLDMMNFFHASRCADETASKPHPQMLHELLGEFRSAPEETFMVGDTEYDMDMANRASVAKIAVSYGAHHVDRLLPYKPVLVVDHFPEFVNWALEQRTV